MQIIRLLALLCSVALLGACAKEPPPRSVLQFIDNPMLLEAAMVRCNQDREQSKYDPECVNARQAAQIVQAREEASRAEELEARSAEKRRALRQAQEVAAEARRRALEAEERRKNKEYIEQFGEPPPVDSGEQNPLATGNLPVAVIPDPDDDAENAADETQAGEPSPTGNEDGTD